MNNKFDIVPGIGLGDIKFGMTQAKVLKILGPADSTETVEYLKNDPDITESWMYEELGVELNFNSDEDFLLTSIVVESDAHMLYGASLIGESLDGLIQFRFKRGCIYDRRDVSHRSTRLESSYWRCMVYGLPY